MIILPNHVYIHCPKTGGSSFEQMMWERHGVPVSGDQHNIAADIPTSDLQKEVFGFMRDPLIAEVSNWRYHYFSWGSSKMTFDEWCEWRYGDKPEEYGYELGLKKARWSTDTHSMLDRPRDTSVMPQEIVWRTGYTGMRTLEMP